MKRVFADTNFWIALADPRDALRTNVLRVQSNLAATQIVTSHSVMTEFLNALSNDPYLRIRAAQLFRKLDENPNTLIVADSNDLFESSLTLYESRPDKAWSLTDCSSFVIMKNYKIVHALTFDIHFQQAGFKALLRSD